MLEFWRLFNDVNIRYISFNLSPIFDLWDSALQLLGLDKIFALSISAIVCWVLWNDRNRLIFSQLTALSLNAFILKILHLFYAWTGTKSSLERLCEDDHLLTFIEE
jgi:hypothetical protein